jgi:hypothetical protein
MEKIIVEPDDAMQKKTLEEFLQQEGIKFKTEDEYRLERQKEAMKIFARMVEESPKIDISDQEIDEIVEEVRAKRYEENNH